MSLLLDENPFFQFKHSNKQFDSSPTKAHVKEISSPELKNDVTLSNLCNSGSFTISVKLRSNDSSVSASWFHDLEQIYSIAEYYTH